MQNSTFQSHLDAHWIKCRAAARRLYNYQNGKVKVGANLTFHRLDAINATANPAKFCWLSFNQHSNICGVHYWILFTPRCTLTWQTTRFIFLFKLIFVSSLDSGLWVQLSMFLTSPSLECRFMNSSVSNFSFWFGTTLGILKRNLGLKYF